MKEGLTLGKFAPLHKGHQLIIETALKEVEHLNVLIYDTDVIDVPLHIRAGWIRKLYPMVNVIEGWDGPPGYGQEREIEILQENYILNVLDGKKIEAFYSGEFYGEHMSRALGALDRRVDPMRAAVPVSGTMIREDPFSYRHYLSPAVYRDLVSLVVFVGAMGTGKSTLAKCMAEELNTVWAPEYGREYWAENQVDRRVTLEDLDNIGGGQIEREEALALMARKYLFVDTCAITTFMYAMDYHGRASDYLSFLALENSRRYDLFFLCEDDIPYEDTWDRSGAGKREIFHKQTVADLLERRIPFVRLTGNLFERKEKVLGTLSRYKKFGNFFG
jgi:NadR type nicotinamide-nucleotide adenylyltransferase